MVSSVSTDLLFERDSITLGICHVSITVGIVTALALVSQWVFGRCAFLVLIMKM